MKILLSHPTGNANVRAVAQALLEAKLLYRFYTCVAVFQNSVFYKLLNFGVLKEFRKRAFIPALKSSTRQRPYKELARIMVQKSGLQNGLLREIGAFSVDEVYRDLDQHISRKLKGINAVYAYEDGALESFKKASLHGIRKLYDLPTGHWRAYRQLLDKEVAIHPEWVKTMVFIQDSETKLARKDEELALADAIFVASSFTVKTLELYPHKLPPVYLIPYGFPKVYTRRSYKRERLSKIKLLFVGGLSQSKGLANLFEAVEHFKDRVELTVVGRKIIESCQPLNEGLKKHHWIPSLPHNEVLELMRTYDLFVFPSLFEGYGLVIAEAMAQGTPVITTHRTCGADFIIDDLNGWLVSAGNTSGLVQKLDYILSDLKCLERVGKAAMETAEKFPMSGYGERMVEAIEKIVNRESFEREN